MSQTLIRSAAMWARRQWVLENHGEEALQELIAQMSAAGRLMLRGEIDPKSWHTYPLFLEFAIKVDQMFGTGDGKLNVELGRTSAHRNTRTIFKPFIRLGSVSWVLNKASKFWRENFNQGSFKVIEHDVPRVVDGELLDWPHPHLFHTYSVLGFAIGCIEMSGETDVRGDVMACRSKGAERTVLRVRWGKDE